MSHEAALRAQGLTKRYRKLTIVSDVSLDVSPGEIVGLLGPNGAGKTTTFGMVVGLVEPTLGKILLGETDVTRLPLHLRALAGIAYLAQEPSIFRRLTVRQNIELVLESLGREGGELTDASTRLMQEFGLSGVAERPAYLLSGGERRRCEIARAMAIQPRYFLLDEPFAGIDPIAVADIQRLVRGLAAARIGVLITDHNVRETLQIVNRAYIIAEGKIFRSGTPAELAEDQAVKSVYLGSDFRLD